MGQHGTLFGVILGAVIVGATLTIKDALDDPETAANVRRKVAEGCQTVKTKICEGGAALREKMEEGGSTLRGKVEAGSHIVREKAEEAGKTILDAVENTGAVKQVKKKVENIRRAAEPAASYLREDGEQERADSETPDVPTANN